MTQISAAAPKLIVPAMLTDTDYLFHQAKEGADAFLMANPFPHLYLPSLIKSSCCVALYEGMQPEGVSHQGHLSNVLRLFLWELSSSTLIRHFSTMTDKPPLLPDPFLINSGVHFWRESLQTHVAEQSFFLRHPETQLLNVLRMELFVSDIPDATFTLECINALGVVEATQIGRNGAVLLTNSDHYHLRYRCSEPSHWRSLLAYYYCNDRARALNGEEQPRDTY